MACRYIFPFSYIHFYPAPLTIVWRQCTHCVFLPYTHQHVLILIERVIQSAYQLISRSPAGSYRNLVGHLTFEMGWMLHIE